MPKTSDLEYAYETLKEDYASHMRTCGTLSQADITIEAHQDTENIYDAGMTFNTLIATRPPTYTVSFIKGNQRYTFETERMTIETQS